ncbi:thiol-disulfide oxidoreductase DCC family protein [Demequina lutea]|uniref:Putative DCC family thiol-disulfide oxidoreductase YuxK n=1 Tax=Demequina lutea TaxID=431489 RepID=A0A7Y9ZB86_9MICO|nr:DCC1-like thiol-disulfide oxidoreductase family protein [Demequina lutea]NYI40915.1 putative DCC family thiol-disulfide oxidoreductase YuxK [Demequina lutea]
MSNPSPIVVFDGECALCNGFVAWLIRHDARGHFLIAGSAGDVGAAVVAAAGLDSRITASTLLVWDGTAHVRSGAIIAVARGLPWPWRVVAGIRVVPRFLRDAAYRYVASRRPRMRAEDPACGVPPADLVALWRSRLASIGDVRA